MKFFDKLKNNTKEKIDMAVTTSISKAEITKELLKSNPAVAKGKEVQDKISSTYRKRAVPILFCILAMLIVVLAASIILGAGYEKDTSKQSENLMDLARKKNVIECDIDAINDFGVKKRIVRNGFCTRLLQRIGPIPIKVTSRDET